MLLRIALSQYAAPRPGAGPVWPVWSPEDRPWLHGALTVPGPVGGLVLGLLLHPCTVSVASLLAAVFLLRALLCRRSSGPCCAGRLRVHTLPGALRECAVFTRLLGSSQLGERAARVLGCLPSGFFFLLF